MSSEAGGADHTITRNRGGGDVDVPIIAAIRLSAFQYKPPADAIYGNAKTMGSFPTRSTVIELETSDGVKGYGEAGGRPSIVREQLKLLQSQFIGRSVHDFELIQASIYARLYHSGVQNEITGLLGGIDVALLDAVGKTFGVRICDLIGGCARTRIPVYASTGYFSEDPDNRYEDMLAKVATTKFLGAKIKIGRGIKSDLERVAVAREILGENILLMVDMNASYGPSVALEAITALAPHRLHWVEEPLPPRDWRAYAELRQRSPVALAAGEALYTAQEFSTLIGHGSVDIVQPSIVNTGGLREARRIAFLAQLANVRVAPHVWGSGLALAVGCHFAATLSDYPNPDFPSQPTFLEFDIGADNPLRDHMLKVPIVFSDSHVELPKDAGLGVEIDWDAIEQFRVI